MVQPFAINIINDDRVISDIIWHMMLTISKKGIPIPLEEYIKRWITFQKIFASRKKSARIIMKNGECWV